MAATSQGGGVDVSGAVYGSARVPLLPVIGVDCREQTPLVFKHLITCARVYTYVFYYTTLLHTIQIFNYK